jgi:hypothetical protein
MQPTIDAQDMSHMQLAIADCGRYPSAGCGCQVKGTKRALLPSL